MIKLPATGLGKIVSHCYVLYYQLRLCLRKAKRHVYPGYEDTYRVNVTPIDILSLYIVRKLQKKVSGSAAGVKNTALVKPCILFISHLFYYGTGSIVRPFRLSAAEILAGYIDKSKDVLFFLIGKRDVKDLRVFQCKTAGSVSVCNHGIYELIIFSKGNISSKICQKRTFF